MKGNIISARRAKSELKQKVRGIRTDGFGKYTCNIFAVNAFGDIKELDRPTDIDRFNDGVMKFLIK